MITIILKDDHCHIVKRDVSLTLYYQQQKGIEK